MRNPGVFRTLDTVVTDFRTRLGDDACWPWYRSQIEGYGHIWVPGVGQRLAHRVMYEHLVGPIPEGLELDHLCRNTLCINPHHHEPVTQRVNTLRSTGPSAVNARKTNCKRDHPLSGANVRLNKRGARVCLACELARWRRVQGYQGFGKASERELCRRGHPLSGDNVRIAQRKATARHGAFVERVCRECERDNSRRYLKRKAAAH